MRCFKCKKKFTEEDVRIEVQEVVQTFCGLKEFRYRLAAFLGLHEFVHTLHTITFTVDICEECFEILFEGGKSDGSKNTEV